MNIATGREPLARPAMPIDIAAPAYHSSALKITRLAFFLADLAADLARAVFLALADLVLFFGIFAPLLPGPDYFIIAGDTARSQYRRKKAQRFTAPG
jgi:hypothetical protein